MLRNRFVVGMFVMIALAIATVAAALKVEEQDRFCASCHSQPETTFVEQAQALKQMSVTLAAYHAKPQEWKNHPQVLLSLTNALLATDIAPVRCIDCHGGVGLAGRIQTLTLAAEDATLWYSGRAIQPAILSHPISDQVCLSCHATVRDTPGFDNHFHSYLKDPKAPTLACTGCHIAHETSSAATNFIERPFVAQPCASCHIALGKGPRVIK